MKNWKYIEGAKTGNSRIGNDTPWEYAHRKPKVINEDKTGAEEFFKQLSDDVKEREEKDDADIEKVGNSTWYEPRRMPFQPRSLQYAYEQAKKKGLSGQKLEAEMLRIAKTTPHDSAATESEMRKDVSEWVLSHGKPEDFVNNKRTGNSAQDDKFAYVMREFDEGKLKTPDGKVVTDPAQAKAIAYSESKKTENGLARARNAMAKNKKVGNHDFEEGDYVLYNGKKAVVRGFNGSQEVIIEQNGQRITTHWSNLEEYE